MKLKGITYQGYERIAQEAEDLSEDEVNRQIVEHVRSALEAEGFESLHDLIKEFKVTVEERNRLLQEKEQV